jgi:hypothetical protein
VVEVECADGNWRQARVSKELAHEVKDPPNPCIQNATISDQVGKLGSWEARCKLQCKLQAAS